MIDKLIRKAIKRKLIANKNSKELVYDFFDGDLSKFQLETLISEENLYFCKLIRNVGSCSE